MITEKSKELRDQYQATLDEMDKLLEIALTEKRSLNADEQKRYTDMETKKDGIGAMIKNVEALADERSGVAGQSTEPLKPAVGESGITVGATRELSKPFKNLGEQLVAVYRACVPGGVVDPRLMKLNQESRAYAGASGMNETIDSEGGFALQTDFAGMLFESAVKTGSILSRVSMYPVSAGSSGAKWVEVDETSIATTVYGGVLMYWTAEADTVTASKPKLMARELQLLKLMGLGYATEEMLQDTTFITALYNQAFTTGIQRKLEGDIVSGTGAGMPLGILNAPCLVAVAEEEAQAADTVIYKNIVKMWAQRWIYGDGANLVWLVHPDVEAQLMLMDMPVGTGGLPVFLPPGGASATPYSSLMGRPVIPTDHCSALGDQGDIILADLSEYQMISKGNVQADTSMHIRFDYAETAFRFIFRANGQPKRASALTIKNSSNTRSPFLTLQAR